MIIQNLFLTWLIESETLSLKSASSENYILNPRWCMDQGIKTCWWRDFFTKKKRPRAVFSGQLVWHEQVGLVVSAGRPPNNNVPLVFPCPSLSSTCIQGSSSLHPCAHSIVIWCPSTRTLLKGILVAVSSCGIVLRLGPSWVPNAPPVKITVVWLQLHFMHESFCSMELTQ